MQEILAVDVGATKLDVARVTPDGLIKKQTSINTTLETRESVLTGELRNQVDAIWNAFWSGGSVVLHEANMAEKSHKILKR